MGVEQRPAWVEGRTYPYNRPENPGAVLYGLARMMQRGVLITYDDHTMGIEERTFKFIDQFGHVIDGYPKVVNLLLNPPEATT